VRDTSFASQCNSRPIPDSPKMGGGEGEIENRTQAGISKTAFGMFAIYFQSHKMVKMGLFRKKKSEYTGDQAVAATPSTSFVPSSIPSNQAVELGTINYVNLTRDGRHGEFETALQVARETGKPIFANFVEWSG
jgi:hypothetical protein